MIFRVPGIYDHDWKTIRDGISLLSREKFPYNSGLSLLFEEPGISRSRVRKGCPAGT